MKRDLNENYIKRVLKEKKTTELIKLVNELVEDRKWDIKMIELLEERVLQLAQRGEDNE